MNCTFTIHPRTRRVHCTRCNRGIVATLDEASKRQRPCRGRENRGVVPHAPIVPPKVAVAVICHNYARYLPECIASIREQTLQPVELLIIDDASTDDTAAISASLGITCIRTCEPGSSPVGPFRARKLAFDQTTAPLFCCVDADDKLSPEYLSAGAPLFSGDPKLAVVYPDLELFGDRTGRVVYPDTFSRDYHARHNFTPACSIFRREALATSGAWEVAPERVAHEDWFLCRRVFAFGWTAAKNSAIYYYRKHGGSRCDTNRDERLGSEGWYKRAALNLEPVTIFIPLSGRFDAWPHLSAWLDRQTWPREQCRLILLDTSQHRQFGLRVRNWIAQSEYQDVRYTTMNVGLKGLADLPRREHATAVRQAMCRIYNWMAQQIGTEYVLVIEDDVIPPADVADRLLRSFGERVASVAAPFRARMHHGYVAWRKLGQNILEPGTGVERIRGNGFGCVMLRRSVLNMTRFTCTHPKTSDFDPAFYEWLAETEFTTLIDWSLECEHLGAGLETAA